ncbi:MAG: glycosyltransferase family 2 protein [Kiritimatiellia bacterium]
MIDTSVSVILPAYNAEGTLLPTLKALTFQTLPPKEILLVDDGSTDQTVPLAERFQATCPSLRLLRQSHKGVSAARNLALEHATGEWLAFCDADDIPEPELYQHLLRTATENRCEIAVCAFRKGTFLQERGCLFPGCGEPVADSRRLFRRLLEHTDQEVRGYLWCALFRRNLFEQKKPVRFLEGLHIQEDELVWLELLLRTPGVAISSRPLYRYQHRDGSATSRYFRSEQPRRHLHGQWALRDKSRARLALEGRHLPIRFLLTWAWHRLLSTRLGGTNL